MKPLLLFLFLVPVVVFAQEGADNTLPAPPVYDRSVWAGASSGNNYYAFEAGFSIARWMMSLSIARIGTEHLESGRLHRPDGIDAGYDMHYEYPVNARISVHGGIGLYARIYTDPDQSNVTGNESYTSTIGAGIRATMFSRLILGAGYTLFLGNKYELPEREQDAYVNLHGTTIHIGYRF
jgi:hypothetical protein